MPGLGRPKTIGLTGCQREVLDFIALYIRRFRRSPSYAEIAKGTGRGTATAFRHVQKLEERGHLITGRDSKNRRCCTFELCGEAEVQAPVKGGIDTDWPTCPHCGYLHLDELSGAVKCEGCGKDFRVERVVTYQTTKE